MVNEQLRIGIVMALRQAEVLKAQAEILQVSLVELAKQVGVQIIENPQSVQPPQKGAAEGSEKLKL